MGNSDTISLGFKLTGEADMKRGLTDLNNALKLNASEMALTQVKYEENGKSAEALTAKNKVLQASIELEKTKMAELKTAIESSSAAHSAAGSNIEKLKTELTAASAKMTEMKASTDTTKAELLAQQTVVKDLTKELSTAEKAYASTGKSTTAWGTELNKAQTNVITMNKELDSNEKAITKSQTGSKSLADAVNGIANAAGINVPPALQGMVSKLESVNAGAAALTVVVAGLVAGLGKLTIDTAKSADEIDVLAKVSGLSTDQIQEFNYSAEQLDVSTETITGSVTKMEKAMNASKNKSSEQAKAFKELHVATTDSHGSLLDINTVFLNSIDALGRVKNETERDVLAMTIFGKSAKDLNPLIEAGSGRMRELAKAAHDTGNVMGPELLAAFTALDDSMKKMDGQFTGVKLALAQILLPLFKSLAEVVSSIPVPVLTAMTVLGGIVLVAAAIGAALTALAPILAGATAGIAALAGPIGLVVAGAIALAAIVVVVMDNWDGISEFFTNLWNGIGDGCNKLTAGIQGWFSAAGDMVKEGWGDITGFFSNLWNGVESIFKTATSAIVDITMAPINAIKELINGIIDGINNLKQSIGNMSLGSIGGSGGLNFNIPSYATGTTNHPGGLALVGENGPEVVNLPRGSKVYPNGVNASGGVLNNYYITIDAHNVDDFSKVVKLAKQKGQRMIQEAN